MNRKVAVVNEPKYDLYFPVLFLDFCLMMLQGGEWNRKEEIQAVTHNMTRLRVMK